MGMLVKPDVFKREPVKRGVSACLNADGSHKMRHASRAEARRVIRRSQGDPNYVGDLEPYRCSSCGYYHVGHAPRRSA